MENQVLSDDGWANPYTSDFRRRFMSLLGFEFRKMTCTLALNILLPSLKSHVQAQELVIEYEKLDKNMCKREISTFDLKRLESYAKNLIDFHLIVDLVPRLAKLYFSRELDCVLRMSYVQASVFLAIGLQYKNIEEISKDLGGLKPNQILPQLNKTIKKFTNVFRKLYEEEAQEQLPSLGNSKDLEKLGTTTGFNEKLGKELDAEGRKFIEELRKQKEDFEKSATKKKFQKKRKNA